MRIVGDVLETAIGTSYGLENRDVYTRIPRVETAEVIEGRVWWLLGIGIPLLFVFFIGIIPIVAFFFVKQKCLIVHNVSGNLVLFYRDTKKAKDFCQTLMAVARQSNSKSAKPSVPPLPKLPAQNARAAAPTAQTISNSV